MELQLNRQPVTINEVVLSTTVEQPVECDVLLPDYCPDIVRILRCSVEPMITQTSVNGDKLTVDGEAIAHVYYKGTDRELCHTDFKMPFSKVVELRAPVENPIISAEAKTSYFNCRAVNQRRLDMRGAISLCLKITALKEEQVLTSAQGLGVQSKSQWMDSTKIAAAKDKNFTIREEVELGYGKAPISSIVRCSAIPSITDQKTIAGKIILKGELQVDLLYMADGPERCLETAKLTVPFSQILDVDGVDEDCNCSIGLKLCCVECSPKADLDGEASAIALEATMSASVIACQCQTYPVSVDCYCTKYEYETEQKTVTFARASEPVREKISIKEMIELPEGITAITDLWTELSGCEVGQDKDNLVLSGKLMVCMFARDADGEMEFYDRAVDFEQILPIGQSCESVDSQISYQIVASSYNVAGGHIDLKCDIAACGMIFCSEKTQVLTDIKVDTERPLMREMVACLTIYFAVEGESVWDIAKRYNTSPELILEENDIEGDLLTSKCKLLIPVL